MITNFPDPYPRELFYSMVARYDFRKAYNVSSAAAKELLGMQNPRAIVDFPRNLQYLEDNLQPGSPYTADYLIDHHTLLSYHGPFIDTKHYQAIRTGMKQSARNSIHMLAAKTAKSGLGLTFLRYCPSCTSRNRKTYGETYWDSVHQIPEVRICPDCQVWLQNSNVGVLELNKRQFIPAEEAIPLFVFKTFRTKEVKK